MNSVHVYLVVEGQTEQTFIRDVLAPRIASHGIFLYPRLIGKPGHKGGDIRFERASIDIGEFLKQRSDTYISTMFDYFRISPAWPGRNTVNEQLALGRRLSASEKAELLETATLNEIASAFPTLNADTRFIPYIEMHEFEALLFSDPGKLAEGLSVTSQTTQNILAQYTNPEEINDDPIKAPSKRIEQLRPGYRKVVMGKTISDAIGIPSIREKCPHFDQWLTRLETLRDDNND